MAVIEHKGNQYIHKIGDTCTIYNYQLNMTDEHPPIEGEIIHQNDIYTTYLLTMPVQLKLIKIGPIKYKPFEETKKLLQMETYEQYLKIKDQLSLSNNQWIYNILEGKSEQENVIARNKEMVLVHSLKWINKKEIEQLCCLALLQRKDITSLRDLTGEHIELLENIVETSLSKIYRLYAVPSEKIKVFIHYRPSVWHLHIHFVHMDANYDKFFSCATGSHMINNIIFNLKMDTDYYKKITLQIHNKSD